MRRSVFRFIAVIFGFTMFFTMTVAAFTDFTDVAPGAWYYNAITTAVEKGYMNGVGDNRFLPEVPMTRAMFVQLLANYTSNYNADDYKNKTRFSDVSDNTWYAPAVEWAADNQIVSGTSETTFSPDQNITRQAMTTMMYNYANRTGNDTVYSPAKFELYTDRSSVSSWAVDAMSWVVDKGIINGTTSTTLSPLNTATRAQVATMIINAEDILTTRIVEDQREEAEADEMLSEEHGLKLSDMNIKITSQSHTATFRLYDTVAAGEFYAQLPLELDLTNFRDAQWMFYPPQELSVTEQEAYHDGKKGELSYYEPWGDVFMLYEDFYAGDEMHRLGICLTGIDEIADMSGNVLIEKDKPNQLKEETSMQISIQVNGNTTVFELNDSQAAKELYAQLPLTIDIENYSTNEKIFYPPEKLNTDDTPLVDAQLGTLAYYAPWGDVVMFYGSFGSASGLYELGHAVSGSEHIKNMSGTIQIEKVEQRKD